MATSSRIGYVGTEIASDVLTKTNFDRLPGGMMGSLSITSPSAATGGTTVVTGLSVAITAGVSRRYRILIHCSSVTNAGAANNSTNIQIFDATGTVTLASRLVDDPAAIGANFAGATLQAWHEPASGAQTYAFRTTTTFTTTSVNASATAPAQIMVFDVGPSY